MIASVTRHRRLTLLLVSSLLASIGIIVPMLWILAPCGLAFFFCLLRTNECSTLKAMWYGLLFGTITGGGGTFWFWDTLPLDFLGIENRSVQWIAIGMTWVYVALSLGLPIALISPLIRACCNLPLYPLAVSLVWIVAEQVRMWGFSLFTWAPASLLGAHFSVSSIGYPMTENSILRQLAFPFGIAGLNFVTAYIAGLGAELVCCRWNIRRLAASGCVGVLITTGGIALQTKSHDSPGTSPSRPLRFAILANNYMDVRGTTNQSFFQEQLATVAHAEPLVDVIALPEEFGLTSIFWSKDEAARFIAQHFGERDVLILNTRNDLYPEDETNSSPDVKKLTYDSTRSGELGRYIKRNLMPLGEYSPAFTRAFFSIIQDPQLRLYIDEVQALPSPSVERPMPAVLFHGTVIGGLLCSDLVSPSLYRDLSRQHDARVLVNLANQFWFHNSRTLYWKTVQMARVHAVQNRSSFLLANNAAPSFALNPRGEFIVESKWGQVGPLYLTLG